MAGTVVFDLDGTIADTAGDLIGAANLVLARRGLGGLDPVADAAYAFAGGRAMLRAGYARASAAMLIPPGAEAALTRLADAGHALAVCTNKPERLADKLLRELGIRDAFASLIGADTLPVRKPDPAPYREAVRRAGGQPGLSFLLGDTETDLRTARAAGVRVALVAFGPEGTGIARMRPDAMLAHYDDLPALAAEWLG